MKIITSISKCILVTFLTLHLIFALTLSVAPVRGPTDMTLGEACGLTRYPQVCMDVIGYFYSNETSQTSPPYEWARRSVDVAFLDLQTLNWTLVTVRDTDHDLTSDEKRAIMGCINDTDAALAHVFEVLIDVNSGSFGGESRETQGHLRSAIIREDSCTTRMSKAGNGEVMVGFANMTTMSSQIIDNALALNDYLAYHLT